ncbi:hypothetical protein D6833_05060 [Candidatus Parcubacteria bacterium]|nr:MAG: hypothetical protein D6833_05060 [Candidatus Parcubacteria bacterium]
MKRKIVFKIPAFLSDGARRAFGSGGRAAANLAECIEDFISHYRGALRKHGFGTETVTLWFNTDDAALSRLAKKAGVSVSELRIYSLARMAVIWRLGYLAGMKKASKDFEKEKSRRERS